jgi:hypothetical protein
VYLGFFFKNLIPKQGTGGESVPGGDMNIPNTVSPLEMMSMGPENSNRLQPINQDYIQAQPEVPAQEPSSPQTEGMKILL